MRTYKKPMITVDSGLAEGVYAASGAGQGTLNVMWQSFLTKISEQKHHLFQPDQQYH